MILEVYNTQLDIYEPLDIYEDFKVEYNHQYEDYKNLTGKKLPYTSKFKIPLTNQNRRLCGVPFDLTYPKAYNIQGRVSDNDGSVVFYCRYEIDSQTTNILEPYLEITVIDALSDAITKLGKTYFDEILTGEGTKFSLYDEHMYTNASGVENYYPLTAPFIFPFYNFNNKEISFSYDPMRNLNQLQPTWIVSHLIKMIFNSVGININSKFLFEDSQIFTGIKSEQLGLLLPVSFYNSDESKFSVNASLKPLDVTQSTGGPSRLTPRSPDTFNQMPPTTELYVQNFNNFIANTSSQKMNWQSYLYGANVGQEYYASEFCSMVDGTVKIKMTKNPLETKTLSFYMGILHDDTAELTKYEWGEVDNSYSQNYPDLDIRLVELQNADIFYGEKLSERNVPTYDLAKAPIVGTASYAGYGQTPIGIGSYWSLKYDITFFDEVFGEIDVQANQRIVLGLVATQKDGVDFGTITPLPIHYKKESERYSAFIEVKDGFIRIKDMTGPQGDPFGSMYTAFHDFSGQYFSFEFSYPEPTELQPVTDWANLFYGNDRP